MNKETQIPWTTFWDMHSGGKLKEPPYNQIYIQAPEKEAIAVFYNRFGHDPNRITCTCCGNDYVIDEEDDIIKASGFHRGCECTDEGYIEEPSTDYPLHEFVPIEEFLENPAKYYSLLIYDEDIKDEEREARIPESGWVWAGE